MLALLGYFPPILRQRLQCKAIALPEFDIAVVSD